jgi:hypothetical protein
MRHPFFYFLLLRVLQSLRLLAFHVNFRLLSIVLSGYAEKTNFN